MIKLTNILQEIRIKQPTPEELIKHAIFNYYKRRLNNPHLNIDDLFIGNYSFNDENELKELIDNYFNSDEYDRLMINLPSSIFSSKTILKM